MRSWHKLLRLSRPEKWLLIQGAVLLALTTLSLRLLGFKRWQSALARLTRRRKAVSGAAVGLLLRRAQLTARLVRAAARHGPYRVSCLQESLTVWWLLRRQGIESSLCVGVRKEAARLEAHAWVEYSGLVLNDSADVRQRFAAFGRAIVPAGVRSS